MIRLVCLLLLSFLISLQAAGEQPSRLALLIGNQKYASAVGPLKNPNKDVALIEASLTALGFKVTVLKDADYRTMDVALKRYVADLRRAGPRALGFFYYSGHGASNAETQINYLVPVDVTSAEDETLWYQSFQQNQIIDLLNKEAANATQFVVFDACRNELHLSNSAAKSIGADKGFVPVSSTAGILIAYSTAPNRTASDAGEGGGPYARALAEELLKPGVEAVTMFRNVQIRVKQAIGQDPWLSFPSLEPVYLAGLGAETGRQAEPQPEPRLSEAARAWEEIKDSKESAVFEAFRKQYGQRNPFYDALAAQKGAALKLPEPNRGQGGLGGGDMIEQGAQQEAGKPAALAGTWSGDGIVVYASGQRERAHCRADYSGDGSTFMMKSRCETPSGTIIQTSRLRKVTANSYAGSFFNNQSKTPGSIYVAVQGNTQNVSIRSSTGSVSLTLKR